ncbi:hypothetical protein D9M71_532950 [compost metagenome]
MRAEARLPGQAQQLRVQATAVTARKEHERLLGQRRHVQPAFAAVCKRMRSVDHRDQGLTEQLRGHQAFRQSQGPYQADFNTFIEHRIGHGLAAHLFKVQVHGRKPLAKGVDRFRDRGVERRR